VPKQIKPERVAYHQSGKRKEEIYIGNSPLYVLVFTWIFFALIAACSISVVFKLVMK